MSKAIIGIQIDNRFDEVAEVQRVLTDNGCIIKTRLGLHQQPENQDLCTEKGLILLELIPDCGEKCDKLEQQLKSVKGIQVRKMEF